MQGAPLWTRSPGEVEQRSDRPGQLPAFPHFRRESGQDALERVEVASFAAQARAHAVEERAQTSALAAVEEQARSGRGGEEREQPADLVDELARRSEVARAALQRGRIDREESVQSRQEL